MKIAVFDIGTNSIHLLLVEIHPDLSFEILVHKKDTTRLGDGSFETGSLSRSRIQEAVRVIRDFHRKAKKAKAQRVIAVATSAVREARNREKFLKEVLKHTGLRVRVISGKEEARLIFLGVRYCANLGNRKALVIDVGGGSVEFIVGDRKKIYFSKSLKLGVARLTDHFIHEDPPSVEELKKLEFFLERHLGETIKKVRRIGYSTLIGTSGTLFNLAAMLYGKGHRELKKRDLEALHNILCRMSVSQRLQFPGLSPKRADLIVAGSTLLKTLMGLLDRRRMILSEWAIREGVVVDFMVKSLRVQGRR